MDRAKIKERARTLYPPLALLPAAELDALLAESPTRTVPAETVIFDEANPCTGFQLLLEGTMRVVKTAPNGRELQLYRVVPGDACVLTSSCLLGHAPYSARGIADSEATLVTLPAPVFNKLITGHEPFRTYVFSLFAERIAELMQLVEAVAFQRLDQRLAALLLGKGKLIHTTHQQLADELGSVREIVSRLLRSFADQGLVGLAREQVEILDPAGLRSIASPTPGS
jgi:CRP/FNR family transcriptional regulator, anaerobic regulatory protein